MLDLNLQVHPRICGQYNIMSNQHFLKNNVKRTTSPRCNLDPAGASNRRGYTTIYLDGRYRQTCLILCFALALPLSDWKRPLSLQPPCSTWSDILMPLASVMLYMHASPIP